MKLSAKEILRRLGAGESIGSVCALAGMARAEFDAWWKNESSARLPATSGSVGAGVQRPVQILRNEWGMPTILAGNDADLFFAFGYAMAQDRLWQLDYLRRRGSGRLAEIFGAGGKELDLLARVIGINDIFELDLLARTVGLRRIAEAEWQRLPQETQRLVESFSAGVNALMKDCGGKLPVEFDLLDYRPEPWSPIDCLTIESEFRWYLTGRFPVIVVPELVKRRLDDRLGDGPLYGAFLQGEYDDESILPPGSYAGVASGAEPVGTAVGEPDGTGSNNWVLAGSYTATGKPLVASDPHVPFDAVSWWYEVYLCGGSFNVAGMAYAGMPAVMFGRNAHVAWGCTNNICSQRDLYQEKTDPEHPNCFLHLGRWVPAREITEVIGVKGSAPVRKTIRFSPNGPIVDEVLPPAARQSGPVSLKWLGAYQGGWLTALQAMDRARSAAEFREAMRPWHVPTFCVVYADVGGHIGYQATGRIPIRHVPERGFRRGWDAQQQWDALIPFEAMPHWEDPERGWIITANNRIAGNDYPYPLSGTWSDGNRAIRIRQRIEAKKALSREENASIHQECQSARARRCLPGLLKVLQTSSNPRHLEAAAVLAGWDGSMEVDRAGASIYSVFFSQWTKAVVKERFDGDAVGLVAGGAAGLAVSLLTEDKAGWFAAGRRAAAILAVMTSALAWLTERLGPEMKSWLWGRLHRVPLRHVLSGRGDLGQLLDQGGLPLRGDLTTVCNTGLGANFEARSGAGYRLIAELVSSPPGLWTVDGQSQSGHPASPHYGDQLRGWVEGQYHHIVLDVQAAEASAKSVLLLSPSSGQE